MFDIRYLTKVTKQDMRSYLSNHVTYSVQTWWVTERPHPGWLQKVLSKFTPRKHYNPQICKPKILVYLEYILEHAVFLMYQILTLNKSRGLAASPPPKHHENLVWKTSFSDFLYANFHP